MKNLTLYCNINSSESKAGGLTAFATTEQHLAVNIENCKVYGDIKTGRATSGGLIGSCGGNVIRIIDCSNYARVETAWGAGGITGGASGATLMRNVSNYGNIVWTKNGDFYQGIGGLAGATGGKIENCANYGEIACMWNGHSGSYWGTGGIFGHVGTSLDIKNTINVGVVVTKSNSGGGILGRGIENQSLLNCYYNETDIDKGVGWGVDSSNIKGKEDTYLKSQAFVNELNGLIEAGKTINNDVTDDPETEEDEREVTIDTNGYAKWVYNAGDYPTLDLTTKWNPTTGKWEKQ